jgi:hypothetical protein
LDAPGRPGVIEAVPAEVLRRLVFEAGAERHIPAHRIEGLTERLDGPEGVLGALLRAQVLVPADDGGLTLNLEAR